LNLTQILQKAKDELEEAATISLQEDKLRDLRVRVDPEDGTIHVLATVITTNGTVTVNTQHTPAP
jgi:hypothetical protein